MKRQVYFSMKSLEEARDIFFSRFSPDLRTEVERVEIEEALGRVTAEPIFARLSAPSFHSAAMDGVAVRAEETYGTTERQPKTLEIGQDAVWLNTGQAIPSSFDAVIMVEKIHQVDEGHLEIRDPAYPWQNVRKVGEDIIVSQLLLPQNHRVRAYDIGALMSGGVFTVPVYKRPEVAIIPTGSELVSIRDLSGGRPLGTHQLIEFNSQVLAGLVRESTGTPWVFDIVPDREERIREALTRAVESNAHVVIINAGSSSGSKDYTVHMIREQGVVLVHGVAMMPGKPTILGVIKGKPVIGNPGYAVSSVISFEQFVKPLLYTLQGQGVPLSQTLKVHPTRDIPSRLGIEEFMRVTIGKVGSRYVATPLPKAAGSITTLTRAEGIIRIPALSEGISQDEEIEAEVLVNPEDLRNTVVIIGSHDITLDLLADEVRQQGHPMRISSGNVGSLGGLMALRKGTCHMAGSHLLDPETCEYNLSYIRRYLNRTRVSVFHLALRDQGLIVAKGNPKAIRGLEDLTRADVRFINRQAGSGTRVLLDHRLGLLGIQPESIRGYAQEEFTHMAVAVAVLSKAADCGMGIFAAAKALDLDFIPVEQEQYDLIVPTLMLGQANIQVILETIRSQHFRDRVMTLGGYDPSASGDLWVEMGGE